MFSIEWRFTLAFTILLHYGVTGTWLQWHNLRNNFFWRFAPFRPIKDDKTLLSEELLKHPAWAKLDAVDCGDSAADRIIGGLNAGLGQFPWIARLGYIESCPGIHGNRVGDCSMVVKCIENAAAHSLISLLEPLTTPTENGLVLFYTSEDDEIDWMCGGALITDRHVVTAAHCVQKSDYGYVLTTIRVGEHDTRTDPDCELKVCAPAVQDRGIKNITSHPSFNKPAFHNDVAIIELDKPVTLNDYVMPICLPRTPEQLANPIIGDQMTVAGWGKMNMTTEERAKVLQVVGIPVVAPALCDSFGKGFKLADSEICAGAEHNKDACGGDSGGPLMKVFDTPDGPKNYLVGVVSFGPTICGIKKPGVYASVSHFLKWILDKLV